MKRLSLEDQKLLYGTSKNAVNCDKFDKEAFEDVKSSSADLMKQEELGTAELPTFPDLMQDVYSTLYKLKPELNNEFEMSSEHMFNYKLMEQLIDNRRIKELRAISQLDKLVSAIGVDTMSEEMIELVKQMKEQIAEAEELGEAIRELQELQDQADENEDEDSEATDAESNKQYSLEEAKKRLEEARANLDKSFEKPEVQQKIGQAAARVKHKTIETSKTIQEWGLGEDSNFQKMPYRNKFELLDKLRQSPKLKRIAEMAGRMTNIALSQQAQKIKKGSEEIYSVTLGRDLEHTLPEEIMKLRDQYRKTEFLLNWTEGKCLQYGLKGKERKAKGPIVACIDESGSMIGEKEVWSKAIAMALQQVAARQKRSFYMIHFNGDTNTQRLPYHEFKKNQPPDMLKVIEMAEHFLGGGTDFEAPLNKAKECIELQPDYHKADIIFLTDGECAVTDAWLKEYKKWKKAKGINVFSILLDAGQNSDATLKEFSDRVFSLKNLVKDSDEVALDIFITI